MAKYHQIADLIRQRIRHGHYRENGLPGLRPLAAELGVHYLTVRQALHLLCEEKLLAVTSNKNFRVAEDLPGSSALKVAMVEPAGSGNNLYAMISRSASRHNGMTRRFIYNHYQDEILTLVLDMDFDLIFFLIDPGKLPQLMLKKMAAAPERLISLIYDYREYGIRFLPEASTDASLELLVRRIAAAGHETLDILAPVHFNPITGQRLDATQKWAEHYRLRVRTFMQEVPDFQQEFVTARRMAASYFDGRSRGRPDAIFVPTVPGAMGVLRQLKDQGCEAGRDFSLVSCEDIELAQNYIPRITVSYTHGMEETVYRMITDALHGDHSTHYDPAPPRLLEGESCRPPFCKGVLHMEPGNVAVN